MPGRLHMLILGALLVAAACSDPASEPLRECDAAGEPAGVELRSDFNGDGFDDLAIAIPGEAVSGVKHAGAVAVVEGGPAGLRHSAGAQLWHRAAPGVPGDPEAGEQFGSVLETGDFDGDGFHDLAIGTPFRNTNGGAVLVLYGSPAGLDAGDPTHLEVEDGSHVFYGSALAAGDFDGDGLDDLAIGAPDAFGDVGAVDVHFGAPGGLHDVAARFRQRVSRAALPDALGLVEKEAFGAGLAAGHLNDDRFADLAVGAARWNLGAGRVYAIFGGGGGLNIDAVQVVSQDTSLVVDQAENSDRFGAVIVAADFDGAAADDLAIGVPAEDHETDPARTDGGAVARLRGVNGITAQQNQLWHQNLPGVPDFVEDGDRAGDELAAGDFNGDGLADLVVAAPYEGLGATTRTGAAHVLYGSSGQFGEACTQYLTHDSPQLAGFLGGAGHDELFGAGLGVGDFNGDGRHDVAIGAPREDVRGAADAGAVYVVYGSGSGLVTATAQVWLQEDVVGAGATSDQNDFFGISLSGGSADCSVFTACFTPSL